MIKAVIFDFDGLILDTETAWYHAYKEVLQEQFQFELPLDEFARCVGSNIAVLFTYLENELGDQFDAEAIHGDAGRIHHELMKEAKACEGVPECLAGAREAGLTIALATSSNREWAIRHLMNLQLFTYFDHLITKDDVEYVKPAPDLFLKAIEVLGIEPHEAFVFEDSLNGLRAAQLAKLPTVIIPNPVTEFSPFEGYHLKLTSMAEMRLQDIIASLNN